MIGDIRLMYDKEYLGAWDIPPGGIEAVIDRVEQGSLPVKGTSKKERKPILFFVGQGKGLILNATNRETVAGFYGYIASEWSGKPIRLITMKVRNAEGKIVEAIRVHPKAPSMSKIMQTPSREPGDDSDQEEAVDA